MSTSELESKGKLGIINQIVILRLILSTAFSFCGLALPQNPPDMVRSKQSTSIFLARARLVVTHHRRA